MKLTKKFRFLERLNDTKKGQFAKQTTLNALVVHGKETDDNFEKLTLINE